MKPRLSIERIQQAAKVLKCISHPDRLRLVECLEGKRRSVNELVELLGLEQAVVSKHLGVLKSEGVVQNQVHRNFRYYSIAYKNVLNVLDCMRKHGGSMK